MHRCIYASMSSSTANYQQRRHKKGSEQKNKYQKGELCLYRTNSLNLLTQKSMVFYE